MPQPKWPQVYRLVIQADGEEVEISPGKAPGWVEWHRQLLDRARRFMLVPLVPFYPCIVVSISLGAHWRYFRRTFGQICGDREREEITLHAVGWQDGDSETLVWVYPNGMVELGKEPTLLSRQSL